MHGDSGEEAMTSFWTLWLLVFVPPMMALCSGQVFGFQMGFLSGLALLGLLQGIWKIEEKP